MNVEELKELNRKTIKEIADYVRCGMRSKSDLKRCGCEYCIKALKELNDYKKDQD